MTSHPYSTSSGTFSDNVFSIAELRDLVRGQVILPDDPVYDDARAVMVGGIDRRPAAIVRAADATDVSRIVSLARERGLELAVRGGGHSMAGHGTIDGGIVLDLSLMKALEIDVAGRTAWAEAGLTAGEYTDKVGALGLATGFGDTGSVGIGGITLGGGVGYLSRRHGLTIDDLLAAEIVTADGEIRYIDARSEPDLFWAIRGGGGNFGVVTRFHFRLHEVDTIVGGMLMLPATPDTVAGFVAAADAAPDELSTIAMVMKAPPMPFIPEEAHGRLVLMAFMCHIGGGDAGEAAIAPFRALAEPIADMVGPKRYPDMYPPEEGFRPTAVMHTMFTDWVDRDVAAQLIRRIEASTGPMAAVQLRVLGGAMARVPAEETAYAHRDAPIMANIVAMYATPEQRPEQEAWVAATAEILRQGDHGAYVNFLADEGEDRVRAAYPGATWERLAAIKRHYDPTNLFRLNQNIPPADVASEEESDAA